MIVYAVATNCWRIRKVRYARQLYPYDVVDVEDVDVEDVEMMWGVVRIRRPGQRPGQQTTPTQNLHYLYLRTSSLYGNNR